MRKVIDTFIPGRPTVKRKIRGDKASPAQWRQSVIEHTKQLQKVKKPCRLKVLFCFAKDQFPKDFPYGPDIDNHLKSFQDALNETIFQDIPGGDSCIMELNAQKKKGTKKIGAYLSIWELA